jgi:hypothetical protein
MHRMTLLCVNKILLIYPMKGNILRYTSAHGKRGCSLTKPTVMKIPSLLLSTLVFTAAAAQQNINFTRAVQFSLAPGISTNGMHPGGYSNYFSLNLTSGYSAANYLLEVGIISNLNERETRGIQVAGLANLTGANAFAGLQWKAIDKKKKEGFEANFSGAQFSGLANVVLNNVFGAQITGGVNLTRGALQGFQVAGISNTVHKYSFAVQLAGVYNVSVESMDGMQLAGLFNVTEGGLHGAQIGIFNRAGFIEGINSFVNKNLTGLQLGLFNSATTMNGYQVGLINRSKQMQGTQIGLINIYRNGKTPETRDGTSIGLLNIGSSGYAAIYASDIFYMNIEIATGTIKNRRRNGDRREKQIQNALIYANDPGFLSHRERWAVGYGLKKYFFNRSLAPGMNKFNFFSLGIDWMHINHERHKWTKELSLLSRPTIAYGSRLHRKNKLCYFFAAVSYNIYKSKSEQSIDAVTHSGTATSTQHWPGFAGGILIQ